jgi:hypothetical protein
VKVVQGSSPTGWVTIWEYEDQHADVADRLREVMALQQPWRDFRVVS